MKRTTTFNIAIGASAVFGVTLLLYILFPLIQYHWVGITEARVAPAAAVETVQFETVATTSNINVSAIEPQPILQPSNTFPAYDTHEHAPEQNQLIIEKIGVRMNIVEGIDESALDQGAWHFTKPVPGQGKNVALAGHRFKYRPPSSETMYLLDKLEPGDEIIVWWEGKKYLYAVAGSKEVAPDKVEVVENHGREELTLITCAPLFSTARRLIITAYPASL